MRIAIGGIEHETNTYASDCFGLTTMADFRQRRGDGLSRMRNTRSYIGGMYAACDAAGYEVVPCLYAWAQPSGTIERATYETLASQLIDDLTTALPVDAVALDLHGAGVVDGIDELESDLARRVRAAIGPDLPLVCTLDLHGNITAEMADELDLMLGVHEYPHIDMYERGVEVIEALPKLIAEEWKPTTHVERLPMLLSTSTTFSGPAAEIRDACFRAEARAGVIDCTFFHGFPYTDIPHVGASVVVTTDNNPALARQVARDIAAEVWQRRDEFRAESLTPEIALRRAVKVAAGRAGSAGPVVVNETSDNPGGGTPGDATHVVRAMIEMGLTEELDRVVMGCIFDPEVAAMANAAGVGATIETRLGGKHDNLHGAPIDGPFYVKSLTDGRFVFSSPMLAGVQANWGPTARLLVGGEDGIEVIVTSVRSQVFDAEIFLLCGIDVTTYDLVVLKSSQHFRAGFEDIAAEIITADSPGLTTLDVGVFDHIRADGPRWPIDAEVRYQP